MAHGYEDSDRVGGEESEARSYAKSRLAGPAIALLIVSILSLVTFCLFGPIGVIANMNTPEFARKPEGERVANMIGQGVGVLVMILFNTIVTIGAFKMKSASSYGMAMTAAIVSMIPCCSPCYVLGIPFGVWALIVLMDEKVKAGFGT